MSNFTKLMQIAAAGAGGVEPWDISKATLDDINLWDISTAVQVRYEDVYSQEQSPQGVFFKPDGSKMYVIGSSFRYVNEYSLATNWKVSSATYVDQYYISEESFPTGVCFSSDGTKMYVSGWLTNDGVYEYDLSTAWDISTTSYNQFFNTSSQETTPYDVQFNSDGTKMYVCGTTNDGVTEYDLSTAWDVSTASYSQVFSTASQTVGPQGMAFGSGGTKMYIVQSNGTTYQYTLSTAWDVSSASYDSISVTLSGDSGAYGLYVHPDGTNIYAAQSQSGRARVYQYDLGGIYIGSQESAPNGIFFDPTGELMYIVGANGDEINQYALSTAWDITTASLDATVSVSSASTAPSGIYYGYGGRRCFITDPSNDRVFVVTTSDYWHFDTGSISVIPSSLFEFDVSSQETTPTGVYFRDNGKKMYVVGSSSDSVHEYNLSIGWNLGYASFSQSFDIAESLSPQDISFNDDGTIMYILSTSPGEDIYQYDLSSAWNISTATYTQTFDFEPFGNSATGLFFKDDGTKFWVVDSTTDKIKAFSIG